MTSAVKFRIDGDPEEPGASAFMQNVRAWWAPFAGKALPKPRGKPGPKRPRIPLTFELVKKTYFELARGYRGEATPTLENVAEAIRNDPDNGIATVSGRTLRRRFNLEWTDREWPPVE